MREIRFRGKRVDNGEWVYGGYVKEHRDNSHLIFVNEFGAINAGFKPRREDFVLNYYEVDPETIGQYTGFKDKIREKSQNKRKIIRAEQTSNSLRDKKYNTKM